MRSFPSRRDQSCLYCLIGDLSRRQRMADELQDSKCGLVICHTVTRFDENPDAPESDFRTLPHG